MRHFNALVFSLLLLSTHAQSHRFGVGVLPLSPYALSYADGTVGLDGCVAVVYNYHDGISPQIAQVVTKLNPDGSLAWSTQLEHTISNAALDLKRVTITMDNSILLLGQSYSMQGNYYVLVKLSAEGEPVWSYTYDADLDNNFGDYGSSSVRSMPDGGASVCFGMLKKSTAMRVDQEGNVLWARSYVTDDEPTEKNPSFDHTVLPDGGMLLCEKAESDIFLVRVDPQGEVLWSQRYPNGAYNHTKCGIAVSTGGFLLGGFSDASAFLMRVDDNGAPEWMNTYTLDDPTLQQYMDGVGSIHELSDGGFLISPTTSSIAVAGFRVDAMGEPTMVKGLTSLSASSTEVLGIHSEEVIMAGVAHRFNADWTSDQTITVLRTGPELEPQCGSLVSALITTELISPFSPLTGCTVTLESVTRAPLDLGATVNAGTPIDLCALMVGVEEATARTTATLLPNLAEVGTALTMTGTTNMVARIERIGADGRLYTVVPTATASGTNTLDTQGWGTGVHTLRLLATDGSTTAVLRAVLH